MICGSSVKIELKQTLQAVITEAEERAISAKVIDKKMK